MRSSLFLSAAAISVLSLGAFDALANDYAGKKILWIDAYHEGYPWSDGIEAGVKNVLEETGATLEIHRMDTKRNKSEEFLVSAGEKTKAAIEAFQPDVVIASDDNAQAYVVKKYYKDAPLPFVFNGVNWSADAYGYPYSNVTGMLEVNAAAELLDILAKMTDGTNIAFLAPDTVTERKDGKFVQELSGVALDKHFVKTFDEWKAKFTELQASHDVVILSNKAGINDWNDDEAAAFAEANTKVPTGTFYTFMAPYTAVVYGKVAEEQGEFAARAALEIIDGKSPSDIPKNTRGNVILNAKIAQAANLDIPVEIIESADSIIE